jgi:hypothetical protein
VVRSYLGHLVAIIGTHHVRASLLNTEPQLQKSGV